MNLKRNKNGMAGSAKIGGKGAPHHDMSAFVLLEHRKHSFGMETLVSAVFLDLRLARLELGKLYPHRRSICIAPLKSEETSS